MTGQYRPVFQKQGPDSNCIINGHLLGWKSCTAYATAMAIDAATGGKRRPSGCAVRRLTGDVTGGLNLNQIGDAARALGISVSVYIGSNSTPPDYVAWVLRAGRGVVLTGNTKVLLGTQYQSTGGAVNHAVYVNQVRGGTLAKPAEALVFDPAADGRRHGVDQGPTWWPWPLVLRFAAALNISANPERYYFALGTRFMYVAVFPDHDPLLRLGARLAKPLPDRVRAKYPDVAIHSQPVKGSSTTTGHLRKGDLFEAWQYINGDEYQGSTLWLGDRQGKRWVHSKRMNYVGGGT